MPADPVVAVILAAGAGRRLGGRPKLLQQVCGRPLVEWVLDRLAAAGVSQALVVTGAHADEVDSQLAGRARSVHNPLSQEYENFVSLAVGLEAAPPGRVLVLNGDVIVADGVLQAVLAETAALALGVCLGDTDDEALRVEIRGDRVVRLGKGLDPLTSAGEFVGVSALSQGARAQYLERADAERTAGRRGLFYEDVYSAICLAEPAMPVAVVAADWAEIDTAADVASAERVAGRDIPT